MAPALRLPVPADTHATRRIDCSALDAMIHYSEDHVILLDLGVADKVMPRVVSLGKTDFTPIEHQPVIV